MTELAKRQTVRTGRGAFGREIWIEHCPAGTYLAGAGTREQDHETWMVCCYIGGTRHGQHYRTLADAEEHFRAVTEPIAAQDA